jgi:hypothetical protein
MKETVMAVEIHEHPDHHHDKETSDNSVLLWTALIVVAAIILGYLAYATYYSSGTYSNYNMPGTYNSTTNNNGATGTTPAPRQDSIPSSPNNVNP